MSRLRSAFEYRYAYVDIAIKYSIGQDKLFLQDQVRIINSVMTVKGQSKNKMNKKKKRENKEHALVCSGKGLALPL